MTLVFSQDITPFSKTDLDDSVVLDFSRQGKRLQIAIEDLTNVSPVLAPRTLRTVWHRSTFFVKTSSPVGTAFLVL